MFPRPHMILCLPSHKWFHVHSVTSDFTFTRPQMILCSSCHKWFDVHHATNDLMFTRPRFILCSSYHKQRSSILLDSSFKTLGTRFLKSANLGSTDHQQEMTTEVPLTSATQLWGDRIMSVFKRTIKAQFLTIIIFYCFFAHTAQGEWKNWDMHAFFRYFIFI